MFESDQQMYKRIDVTSNFLFIQSQVSWNVKLQHTNIPSLWILTLTAMTA